MSAVEHRSDGPTTDAWRAMSDRALVDAIRARRPEAVDEFIRRFEETALRAARFFRVPRAEQAAWAVEVLYDVATTLARPAGRIPRTLAGYVMGACRHRALHERTSHARHEQRIRDAQVDIGHGEVAVRSAVSEATLRAACGPAADGGALPAVFTGLLEAVDAAMSPSERALLTLLAHDVSYTAIARHFAITRPAAVSRVQRLRKKLIALTYRYGRGLAGAADRQRLGRFLARAGRPPLDSPPLTLEPEVSR